MIKKCLKEELLKGKQELFKIVYLAIKVLILKIIWVRIVALVNSKFLLKKNIIQ